VPEEKVKRCHCKCKDKSKCLHKCCKKEECQSCVDITIEDRDKKYVRLWIIFEGFFLLFSSFFSFLSFYSSFFFFACE
jgi:hypothetical protein